MAHSLLHSVHTADRPAKRAWNPLVDLSRDDVIERVAEVSHATWVLQAIRDYCKSFDELEIRPPMDCEGLEEIDSERYRADLAEAERRLRAVRAGSSLAEFSDREAERVAPHDEERAKEVILALEALGVSFD